MASPGAAGPIRFGAFEFNPTSVELRKGRTRLRVPEQSLVILSMLLERPGELVTRESIQTRLWPNGTVVEFENSVNSAVKRLREALSDTVGTPRYIETLPRKGYRFVGVLAREDGGRSDLTPGTVISHYRILGEAGRGAMGVVYKAEDTRLGRMVAVKFLPDDLAAHQPALDRLRREARMIGALNHPGICTVYELEEASGHIFLVMEFLEGESLRNRMVRGPLANDEILDIALQAAKALEAAHGQGMVHRDIKPDNLFLTKQGAVKLLDFGLAKLVEEESGAAQQTSITGTSGYMSPEQVRGEPLDARSDIYSVGRVLTELAGPRPPARLVPILKKAMDADPTKRWQSVGELRAALERIQRKVRSRLALLVEVVATVVAAAWLVAWLRGVRTEENFSPVPLVSFSGLVVQPSFSPDGSQVVFTHIVTRDLSQSAADDAGIYVVQAGGSTVRLTADESDRSPAWSPDGRSIAFIRDAGQDVARIMLIPVMGGAPRELGKMPVASHITSISWTPDARWLVVSGRESPLQPFAIWLVSAESGERRQLLRPLEINPSLATSAGDYPGPISPDGRMLVFARTLDGSNFKLFVVRLASKLQPEGPPEAVTDQTYSRINGIAWAGEREVVFACYPGVYGELFRTPVAGGTSPRRLDWAPRAEWPATARSQHRLVYGQSHPNENLWRLDMRTGQCRLLVGSIYRQYAPQFSPDGRRIAFTRSGPHAVWTCDADGGNCEQRASFAGSLGGVPRWSPDGRWLTFDSYEGGKAQIYVISAGGGERRRLTGGNAENRIPSWSRDGRWIYFDSDRSGQWRVWKAPSGGGEPVQVTHGRGGAAFESADGKYLYFAPSVPDGPLYRMPVEGGEELQVAPHLVSSEGFAVTPRGVYVLSDEHTIDLLDEKTGLIHTVAKLEKNTAYTGLAVSADGAFVVFNQMDYRADLMLVEGFR